MKLFSKKQIETSEEEKLGTPAVDGEGQQETDKTQEVMAYIRKPISMEEGKARVDATQCVGCGVCAQLCGFGALAGGKEAE